MVRTMTIAWRRAVLPVAVLALAGSGAVAAAAKTVTSYNVVSPSKLIACSAVLQSTEIECTAPYLPDIGDLDSYYALRPHGTAVLSQRGDFPGHSTPQRTLHYGDTWKRAGISCTMRTAGLTCQNLDGHGFHIQKGNTPRF